MSNLVEIKELGKCYGKKKVMNNLSLSLESGRIVGILGPNGSGKSTLIKMMAGVLKPTSGQIIIRIRPVLRRPKQRAVPLLSLLHLLYEETAHSLSLLLPPGRLTAPLCG